MLLADTPATGRSGPALGPAAERTAPPEKIIPRGGAPLGLRFCTECGHPFHPARHDQHFCRPACRKDHHHRRAARGVLALDACLAWRKTRRKGGMTDVCQLVDSWLAEDRARAKAHAEIRAAYAAQQKPRPAPAAEQQESKR